MTKFTGSALDRAVANAMGLKSVTNCEKWVRTCPDCEYHKNRAARWRAEAYKLVGHEIELPWVGLTNEDKQIAFDDTQEGGGFWEFADAIEAKLRQKNT